MKLQKTSYELRYVFSAISGLLIDIDIKNEKIRRYSLCFCFNDMILSFLFSRAILMDWQHYIFIVFIT